MRVLAGKMVWIFAGIIGLQLVVRLCLPLEFNIEYSAYYMWVTWISFGGATISYILYKVLERNAN